MSTLRATVRLTLGCRLAGIWMLWVVMAGIVLLNIVLYVLFVPAESNSNGALTALPVAVVVTGAIAASRQLPFALTAGLTRRRFYTETTLVMTAVFALWSAGCATFALVEDATGGWGVGLRLFRLSGLLGGGWGTMVGLLLPSLVTAFAIGWIFGLIHRRWGTAGVLVALGALLVIGIVVGMLATGVPAFAAVPEFFAEATVARVIGLLGVLAVGTVGIGYLLTRRMPV